MTTLRAGLGFRVDTYLTHAPTPSVAVVKHVQYSISSAFTSQQMEGCLLVLCVCRNEINTVYHISPMVACEWWLNVEREEGLCAADPGLLKT
ncbi:unnamed protein product [Arctogadus glacialis]